LIFTRVPEELGVYKSILYISICRGDLPSAALAYKYISLHNNSYNILSAVLWKAAAFHFSALPSEIIHLEKNNIWKAIAGMCNSCLDKRALSLFLMLSNNSNTKSIRVFKNWLEANKEMSQNFSSVEDRIVYAAIRHLQTNELDIAEDYFSYNAPVDDNFALPSKINPMYLLGKDSWFYKHIDNSLGIIYNSSNISNLIYLFEINKIVRKMEHENYWEDAKLSVLGAQNEYIEELWVDTLQPYTEALLKDISEIRMPYGKNP
jgi:hypothetical protein